MGDSEGLWGKWSKSGGDDDDDGGDDDDDDVDHDGYDDDDDDDVDVDVDDRLDWEMSLKKLPWTLWKLIHIVPIQTQLAVAWTMNEDAILIALVRSRGEICLGRNMRVNNPIASMVMVYLSYLHIFTYMNAWFLW